MIEEEKYKTHSKYYLYRIDNKTSNSKKGKKFYIVSSIDDMDKVRTMIRGMVKSRTTRGGVKAIASQMSQSKDYKADFSIKLVHKGTKNDCQVLKNKLKSDAPPATLYNKPRPSTSK